VLDISGIATNLDIGNSLVLNPAVSDNVTANDKLAWDVTVEKDGNVVTNNVYTPATKTFLPTSVGVYDFTLKITDEAGNYIISYFSVNAEMNVWTGKDYTFTTAAGTATTSAELAHVVVGTNGIEFKKDYAPYAYTYVQHPLRKFELVESGSVAPVELSGNFFVEFDYSSVDSYQNQDNSRIGFEFVRKGTTIYDDIYILNNYMLLEYFSNVNGVGAAGTGIYVTSGASKLKIGRFIDETAGECTYVYYDNNVPVAFQSVGANYADEVTVRAYSYKSMGTIQNLRLGMFDDTDEPSISVKENFPTAAENNEKINLDNLFIEDNIVPEKFVKLLFDVKDSDGTTVGVDFNRTFRATKSGNYSVKIKAQDFCGNISTEVSAAVSVSDSEAPAIGFAGQVSSAIIDVDTAVAPIIIDNFIGDINVTSAVIKDGAPATTATLTKSGTVYLFKATAAGEYRLDFTATDKNGNIGAGSFAITAVTADIVAPVITIEDPGQLMTQMSNVMYWNVTDNVTASGDIVITSRMVKGGSASDNGSVAGGTALNASGTPGVTANWYNPVTRIFSTYQRGTSSTGDYFLEVTATDAAGNASVKSLKINVKQTGDVYDTVEYIGWGWESYHNRDKYVGIVLGKDSVTIPSRASNSGDQLNFVPYVRKYFSPSETMNGDFDFDIDYEDIAPAITSECNVRIMLYYAADAENTMKRQTDTIAFGATANQSWLEVALEGGSWQNGPQKIELSGKHHLKVERRVFKGAAYYRYWIDEVCLNPDGYNAGTNYKQYLVGLNFFGHKAGGKFTNITFTQK
jgi:hypothetical protein